MAWNLWQWANTRRDFYHSAGADPGGARRARAPLRQKKKEGRKGKERKEKEKEKEKET